MNKTPVNLSKLNAILDQQIVQGIKYRLGGKAPSLSSPPSALESGIDCSGIVRLLIYQATDGEVVWPDGSWNQRDYCEKNYERVSYEQAMNPKAGECYANFITPNQNGAGKIGHVWLTLQRDTDAAGETAESWGGHGIGSRAASTPVLKRLVAASFKLPIDPKVVATPKPENDKTEQPQLSWNGGELLPMEMGRDGRPYVQVAAIAERMGQIIMATTDNTDEPEPRFYVNSVPRK